MVFIGVATCKSDRELKDAALDLQLLGAKIEKHGLKLTAEYEPASGAALIESEEKIMEMTAIFESIEDHGVSVLYHRGKKR